MKINQTAIASIALLSFFSSVMADDKPTVTEMSGGGIYRNIGPDGLITVKILNTNPDGSLRTTIYVERMSTATSVEGPKPTVTEMSGGGIYRNIGPDGLITVTIRNTNPDGSIRTTIYVERMSTTTSVGGSESTPPATGYESQPESTKPGYETETINNAVVKLSFSMLSGLVALLAI